VPVATVWRRLPIPSGLLHDPSISGELLPYLAKPHILGYLEWVIVSLLLSMRLILRVGKLRTSCTLEPLPVEYIVYGCWKVQYGS
jgi:hypothetical protein